jgi:hypothetical protein
MFITYLDLSINKIVEVINAEQKTKHTVDSVVSFMFMTQDYLKKVVKMYYDCAEKNFCFHQTNDTIKILEFQHPLQKDIKTGYELSIFLIRYDLLSIANKQKGNIEQLKYDLKRHLIFK